VVGVQEDERRRIALGSCRNAAIGSSLPARIAGVTPNTTPTNMQTANAMTTIGSVI